LQKYHFTDAGIVKVVVSIQVIVPGCYAHAIGWPIGASSFGNFGKTPQAAAWPVITPKFVTKIPVVCDISILVAIIIKIRKHGAATFGVRQADPRIQGRQLGRAIPEITIQGVWAITISQIQVVKTIVVIVSPGLPGGMVGDVVGAVYAGSGSTVLKSDRTKG
jgi:hypothetical protein